MWVSPQLKIGLKEKNVSFLYINKKVIDKVDFLLCLLLTKNIRSIMLGINKDLSGESSIF